MQEFIKKFKEEHKAAYRAIRTFIQAFVTSAILQLTGLSPEGVTKKVLFTICVSAGSAALAAVMNMKPDDSDEENTEGLG